MYCFDETVTNKILLKLKFNFRKYKMNFTLSAELPYIDNMKEVCLLSFKLIHY